MESYEYYVQYYNQKKKTHIIRLTKQFPVCYVVNTSAQCYTFSWGSNLGNANGLKHIEEE